jgi:hypothetical protein
MNRELLITCEILLAVVSPLLILYLKSTWRLHVTIACMVVIPPLWYLTYAPLHEIAHMIGIYLVGGRMVDYKLIPHFWVGEYGTAWIQTTGITRPWQQLVSTGSPYVLNVICIVAGLFLIRRRLSGNPFVIGLVFMLLCLRPAFDFLSELTGYVSGNRGDYDALRTIVGSGLVWVYIVFSLGLSLISIVVIVRRFVAIRLSDHHVAMQIDEN